ncbi:MAG: hypothetical protein PHY43_00500 [Verrucomicrobiales bacterium]|nr:hypothetical protein [Verrucomicrobiales bacterium]
MKLLIFAFCVTLLIGCSTPNPDPGATAVVYEQFMHGIDSGQVYRRQDVYILLGKPHSVKPPGDIYHCRTATWKIPHDVSGWGHLTVVFSNDIAVNRDWNLITARVYKRVSFDEILKMQPFDATIEEVTVERHWFFDPDVIIDLKRNDNGKRLALRIVNATKLSLKFADELQKGGNYVFPKVITDFFEEHHAQAG